MPEVTIEIFDDVSPGTFKQVKHLTDELSDGSTVNLLISSYGGEILPTISIIETLKRFHTKAYVIGFACSSAAILAISCDECSMSENSSMLLHSAWSDGVDEEDPGIKRCNDLQLSIIKKRCPDFDSKLLKKDTWLSADECLSMHLVDDIYINDAIDINYAALCKKYAAKLSNYFINSKKEIKMEEEKINEVVEEVKEEVAEAPVEDHDLIEVIEKLSEELNALKARVMALEEVEEEEVKEDEKIEATCDEDADKERINNIYKNIVAPQARIAIGAPKAAAHKSIHKVDYKSFASFING